MAELGLSLDLYAAYNTALVVFALLFWALAAVIFWRRSDDLMALYTSLTLVLSGAFLPDWISVLAPLYPSLTPALDLLTSAMYCCLFILFSWVRPMLVVAIGLAIFQQIIGINTIIYYAPTPLTEAGFGDQAATYANVIIGVINVIMTLVAIRLIDRTGRVSLLVTGLIGMIGSLVVLGVSSLLLPSPQNPTDPLAIITLICLTTSVASFAASWGPTVWVMLPEILPLRVRGTASGIAIFLHWGANFVLSQTFPSPSPPSAQAPSSSPTPS